MLKFIRFLPDWAEFIIILAICFGYFSAISLWIFFNPELMGSLTFTDYGCFLLIYFEVLAFFAAALFLAVRGWDFSQFQVRISWRSSAVGILLFGIHNVIFFVINYGLSSFIDSVEIFKSLLSYGPSLPVAVLVSVVNPIFEEIAVVGYVFLAVERKFDARVAVFVSVALRSLYHLYQGVYALASILPLGILFAVVYWRWRNLWPLILAHGLLDFIVLYRVW